MLLGFLTHNRGRFYESNGGGGGSGGSNGQAEGEGEGEQNQNSGRIRASDLRSQLGSTVDEQALMRLLERQAEVLNDNYQLREKNRKQREDHSKQTVLSAEDLTRWQAYQKLGTPEEITAAMTERDDARGKLSSYERKELLGKAADAHGYDAAALSKMPSLNGKKIELTTRKEGENDITEAVVIDGDKRTALPAYLEQHDPELMAALTKSSDSQQNSQRNQRKAGAFVPRQSANQTKPAAENAGEQHVKRTNYAIPGKKK